MLCALYVLISAVLQDTYAAAGFLKAKYVAFIKKSIRWAQLVPRNVHVPRGKTAAVSNGGGDTTFGFFEET